MAKPKLKRGRFENLTYREYTCSDLLSVCDESSSNVPDVEIDLFCEETSVDDEWDEEDSPTPKKLRLEDERAQETISLPETDSRNVPPNSPMSHTGTQEMHSNPFVSYLLQIWSERKFNSPRMDTRSEEPESQLVFDNAALVLEDPVFNSAPCEEEEQVQGNSNTSDHIVPDLINQSDPEDLNIESNDEDFDFDSQRSRVLHSCVTGDHIVPVRFLEE